MILKVEDGTEQTIALDLVEYEGSIYVTARTEDTYFTLVEFKVNEDEELELVRAEGVGYPGFNTDEFGRIVDATDTEDYYGDFPDDVDEEEFYAGDYVEEEFCDHCGEPIEEEEL